jgi:hypothetical protein
MEVATGAVVVTGAEVATGTGVVAGAEAETRGETFALSEGALLPFSRQPQSATKAAARKIALAFILFSMLTFSLFTTLFPRASSDFIRVS